jgi:hypothetical protein
MIVIHVNWISTADQIKLIRIEKESFDDAVDHVRKIIDRADVLGVQITWEKGTK